MTMTRLASCILAAAVIGAAPAVAKPAELSSRYTRFGGGCLIEDGSALGQDWGLQKCKGYGGIPVWWVFSDSSRGYLGFGVKRNVSGTFGFKRNNAKWPIEWRGRMQSRKFQPLAVIVRMDRPAGSYEGPDPMELFVFRLRSDGTSCIVGDAIRSNEEARKIADAAADEFRCRQEPQTL